MIEVTSVGAMWSPSKSIVAAWQNGDSSSVNLLESTDGGIEFLLVANFLGLFIRVPESGCVVDYVISQYLAVVRGG